MRPVSDAIRFLDDETVALVVQLIRSDPVLGRGTFSSWEEVAPSEWEATERVRTLIEEGIVPVVGRATPAAIVEALRRAESQFWMTG
jgi:hypothetical protein